VLWRRWKRGVVVGVGVVVVGAYANVLVGRWVECRGSFLLWGLVHASRLVVVVVVSLFVFFFLRKLSRQGAEAVLRTAECR
jgi:hypothetical protein